MDQPLPGRIKQKVALDRLGEEIRLMRIEYEKYFNGALPAPPSELNLVIENQIRILRGSLRGSVDNFRLANLEARYNTYKELLNRRLRDREEGRTAASAGRPRPSFDARKGIVLDGELEDEAVAALYQGLYMESAQSSRIDLEGFRSYLDRQVEKIRKKTGCTRVQFRLASEDGKMKLKAKPVQGD